MYTVGIQTVNGKHVRTLRLSFGQMQLHDE